MAGIFDFETPDQLDGITNPTADDRPRWSKKASSTPTRFSRFGTFPPPLPSTNLGRGGVTALGAHVNLHRDDVGENDQELSTIGRAELYLLS